jgi:peptide/nickel transport system permease protein
VAELIAQRVEPTLALATCTLLFAVSIAVPMGVLAAYRQGSLFDRLVMAFSVMGFSVPGFVIGYCLIYVFAIELGWLPVQGYIRIGVNFGGFLERMILPSLTLSVGFVALITRITRASVLEVLNEDYIRTARAKPSLTVIGIGIAILMGGAVVTESVFGLPGLGRLTVEAVLSRDFPTIQTVILLFSVVYVVINLLIDISYTLFDPRIRY